MSAARTCGRAGACRAFYGEHGSAAGGSLEARQKERESAHVGRFFLYPHNFTRRRVTLDFRRQFRFGEWVKLLEEDDRGRSILQSVAFSYELVADFARADQNSRRIFGALVRDDRQEMLLR